MILNLIITSYNFPLYSELVEQWKRYMNICPEVLSYFLVNDPSQFQNQKDYGKSFKIENEFIYFNVPEIPIPGIFEKTIKAMEIFSKQEIMWNNVEYVIRTNLSSFYIWDRVISHMKDMPKTRLIGGGINMTPIPPYVSGCGMIMSKDMCELLISSFSDPSKFYLDDDRMIGKVFHDNGIELTDIPRFNIPYHEFDIKDFDELILQNIPPEVFQIRTRCGTDEFRLLYGSKIYAKFIDAFYPSLRNA